MPVTIDERYLIEVARNLVAIDSVNPTLVPGGAGEAKIADYVLKQLLDLGLDARLDPVVEGRPNVLAVRAGSGGGPSLILNGHMDTVGVAGMTIDPFDPRISDGRLYGRGALDMKGGLACIMAAVKGILEANIDLKGGLILAFTVDEEYASIGMESIRKQIKADAGLITEPTGLELVTAHKGFSWIEIETRGKAVHGSLHDVGVDAIVNMGRVLEQIQLLNQSVYPAIKHELLGSPSIHASLISGGQELSTYPEHCKLQVERRNLPHEDHKAVEREVESVLAILEANQPSFKAKGSVTFTRPGSDLPHDLPIIAELSGQFERHFGRPAEPRGMAAWPEAALLTEVGIPTILFGPTGRDPHAPVEYVALDSLFTCARVVADTVVAYCGRNA